MAERRIRLALLVAVLALAGCGNNVADLPPPTRVTPASARPRPTTTVTGPYGSPEVFGPLGVAPTGSLRSPCAGSYVPGESLMLSASGYAPGATVSVLMTSPGLGLLPTAQIATLTASSAGAVSGVVVLPAKGRGYALSPGKGGGELISLDLVGSAAGSGQVDDSAILHLVAASTRTCHSVSG